MQNREDGKSRRLINYGHGLLSELQIKLPNESCSKCVNLEFLPRKNYLNSEKQELMSYNVIYEERKPVGNVAAFRSKS